MFYRVRNIVQAEGVSGLARRSIAYAYRRVTAELSDMTWKNRLVQSLNRVLHRFDIRIVRGSDIWRTIERLGHQPAAGAVPAELPPAPYFKVYTGSSLGSPQRPFDFAVVMPTILRPATVEAVRSIFAQDLPGRVQ